MKKADFLYPVSPASTHESLAPLDDSFEAFGSKTKAKEKKNGYSTTIPSKFKDPLKNASTLNMTIRSISITSKATSSIKLAVTKPLFFKLSKHRGSICPESMEKLDILIEKPPTRKDTNQPLVASQELTYLSRRTSMQMPIKAPASSDTVSKTLTNTYQQIHKQYGQVRIDKRVNFLVGLPCKRVEINELFIRPLTPILKQSKLLQNARPVSAPKKVHFCRNKFILIF